MYRRQENNSFADPEPRFFFAFSRMEDQDSLSFESEPKPKEFRKTRIGATQKIFVSTTLDENGLCNCYKYVFELY